MDEITIDKCRTCLKTDARTFPLNKYAKGCVPSKTYAHLLKEFAKFDFNLEEEQLLPQRLCLLCCRQLRITYAFVRQAQYCNSKLIKIMKLDCLREQTIDVPSIELDKSVNIKIEKGNENYVVCSTDEVETMTDAINIRNEEESTENTLFLKAEFLEDTPENELANIVRDIQEMDDDDAMNSNQNQLIDITIEYATTSDNNISTTILNDTSASTETSEPKVPCPICKKIISRRDNLIKHMRVLHDIKDPSKLLLKQKPIVKEQIFPCELCPCKYSNKYSYLNHLKDKHSIERKPNKKETIKIQNKIIKCRSCDYTAKTYAALHYHNRSKHGTEDDKFKCKFCTYMCLKKFDLLVHVKNVHKDVIKTLKADMENKMETLSDPTNLPETSMKTDIAANPEQSDLGNPVDMPDQLMSSTKTVTQDEHFSSDDNNDDNGDSSDDNIPLAQKVIKSQEEADNNDFNVDNESSDEEFIRGILDIKKRQPKSASTRYLARRCDECGNIYKNRQALYAHQRHVHISEDKYSLCSHCGKKYKRKSDLRNHIEKAHTPKTVTDVIKPPPKVREKRFMCTECSYVCSTITILKIHMNRHHTGEKPYKCDICFKSFIVPYDLKVHRYLHTGERPHKCPICFKGFRDSSHMVKHKRIHSGDRPYKCKDCGKGFTQSYNLSVHKRTHLKEKKLNCPICGKLFESKSLLNIHRISENHHDEVI